MPLNTLTLTQYRTQAYISLPKISTTPPRIPLTHPSLHNYLYTSPPKSWNNSLPGNIKCIVEYIYITWIQKQIAHNQAFIVRGSSLSVTAHGKSLISDTNSSPTLVPLSPGLSPGNSSPRPHMAIPFHGCPSYNLKAQCQAHPLYIKVLLSKKCLYNMKPLLLLYHF